jgi:2,4-dienoyl-CoA reductase-like NADH-dependent reductase (Old Yellow Enzyme family)
MSAPLLFSPLQLRDVRLRNRVAISPMAQYCAEKGCATDWHFAHLAAFATGGAALVFTESTKVERSGLGSHGDLCLWNEDHVASLLRITDFIRLSGSAAGMQLNHSGRKARSQRPWEGFGPLDEPEEDLWPVVAPSAVRHAEGWAMPREMTRADIRDMVETWARSAMLAHRAGFEVLEIHGAHGYLVHQFLSPETNRRGDEYGGKLANRMRFALELTEAVRAAWPAALPLFFRVSSTDDMGWTLEDTVALSRELKARGVDVIDCSSGGMTSRSPTASGVFRGLGYQVPYAARVRRDADIPTMAVGLIVGPAQAERILADGDADIIAIGREALLDPYWAHHAAQALGADPGFERWPKQYGWWLDRRRKAGIAGEPPAPAAAIQDRTHVRSTA